MGQNHKLFGKCMFAVHSINSIWQGYDILVAGYGSEDLPTPLTNYIRGKSLACLLTANLSWLFVYDVEGGNLEHDAAAAPCLFLGLVPYV